ncbi:MAG: tRNA pseudouridine(38-40) synthase TruA [Bacillota bacterium]
MIRLRTTGEQLRLTIAYDGGEFYGFQRQREEPTVQSCLERALERINREPVRIRGAGRTDSGVHARGQVVCFRPAVTLPLQRWPEALNGLLPPSLVVVRVDRVPASFDPVRDARWKHYRYRVVAGGFRWPFEARFVHWVPYGLDVRKMQRAAARLLGRRDCAPFQVSGRPVRSTVRTIYQAAVTERDGVVSLDVVADGFLYRMARRIAGTLIEVGRGAIFPSDVDRIIGAGDRSLAGPTAPARGLCLMYVKY